MEAARGVAGAELEHHMRRRAGGQAGVVASGQAGIGRREGRDAENLVEEIVVGGGLGRRVVVRHERARRTN